MAQVIRIRRRTTGPGEPVSLALGELAYNTESKTLYIGTVSGLVSLLVGAERQLELDGDQTFVVGAKKTIHVDDLKLLGGADGFYLQTDGDGNLVFASAITVPAALVPVTPPVAGATDVQAALEALKLLIDALSAEVAMRKEI